MKTIVVTGYLPLNVTHRSQKEYTTLGERLFAVGLPTVAFLDPAVTVAAGSNVQRIDATLQECWYRQLLTPGVRNPAGNNHEKDTFDHYTVEHQKTTWTKLALEKTDADAALWVDLGVFHLGDFTAALRDMVARIETAGPDKILMPTLRPLPKGRFDCSQPQWFCAGGVFLVPRQHATWFDEATRTTARTIIDETRAATWEVNTWARVMQAAPEKFEPYGANHGILLFTGYQPQRRVTPMKIAVYALAKNEEKHAAAWAESCKEADYRVVTDTGSTDKTPDILRTAGVNVHTGNVIPWRWDEAHNLSLHHVPSDADVCVRLDLDERFKPGWREAIEKAWKPGMTKLRYMYTWSMSPDGQALKKFPSDRVHARAGMRWLGATHEGLVKWSTGEENFGWSNELEILHYRDANKTHSTDLDLLQIAVREMPHDARMHWYLARQMDYEGHTGTVPMFTKYLAMPGGSPAERAYACRVLARRIPDKAESWYQRAIQEDPTAPEGYYELAKIAHENKDHLAAFFWATQATARNTTPLHTSDMDAFGHVPPDIAAVNAYVLKLFDQSLHYTQIAAERSPKDARLQSNLAGLKEQLATH